MEEYDENVETLAKLFDGKSHPAAQVVQQLLDDTRSQRKKWLQRDISIREIDEKYPCFKTSKFVSHCPIVLLPFILLGVKSCSFYLSSPSYVMEML